jgi:hypothetical protein
LEIRDLTHDEQLALVALIEFAVASNRDVTDEEIEEINQVAAALGRKRYQKLAEEADDRFSDEEALQDYLLEVTRQEARELIYGVVLETALADADTLRHSEFLEWLADEWDVSVELESES